MKVLDAKSPKTQRVRIPVLKKLDYEKDGYDYEFIKWRYVNVPAAKFCIYKDTYHDGLHISTISDMFATVGAYYWDFEDFDASYIVATFDTIEEAAKYAIKHNYLTKFVDNPDFVEEAANGEYSKEDFNKWNGPASALIEMLLGFAEIKNTPDDWNEVLANESRSY